MSVHYKFKSSLDYDTVTFDGLHISVADLKKAILQQKKIGKGFDFDLKITNAQTKEVYSDEDCLIPKNASVIVSRVPNSSSGKKGWDRNDSPSLMPAVANSDSDSVSFNKVTKSADLVSANASEDEKIRAMMSQSTLEYDPSRYVKTKTMVGPTPTNYTCYRCGRTGHWIKNCPTNAMDVKRSTGIPRSFMVTVDGPDVPGALLTSTGHYAVPMIDHEAYKEGKKEKPPFAKAASPTKEEQSQIPEELLCMICRDLLTDAVLIPCCGNSYCDECVRQALLDSDDHECPTCHEKGISPDTLIPVRLLRTAVMNFKNETGYIKSKKTQDVTVALENEPSCSSSLTVAELAEQALAQSEESKDNFADVKETGKLEHPDTPVRDELAEGVAVPESAPNHVSSPGINATHLKEEPEAFSIKTITTRQPGLGPSVPMMPMKMNRMPLLREGPYPHDPYMDPNLRHVHHGHHHPHREMDSMRLGPPGISNHPQHGMGGPPMHHMPYRSHMPQGPMHQFPPNYRPPPPMMKPPPLQRHLPPSHLSGVHQPPPPHMMNMPHQSQQFYPQMRHLPPPLPNNFAGPPPQGLQHRRPLPPPTGPNPNPSSQPLPPGVRPTAPPPVSSHSMQQPPVAYHPGMPPPYPPRPDDYYQEPRTYPERERTALDPMDAFARELFDYHREDRSTRRRSSSSSRSYSSRSGYRSPRSSMSPRSSRSKSRSYSSRSRSGSGSYSRSRSRSHHRSRTPTSRSRSRSRSKARGSKYSPPSKHRRSRTRSPRSRDCSPIPSSKSQIPPLMASNRRRRERDYSPNNVYNMYHRDAPSSGGGGGGPPPPSHAPPSAHAAPPPYDLRGRYMEGYRYDAYGHHNAFEEDARYMRDPRYDYLRYEEYYHQQGLPPPRPMRGAWPEQQSSPDSMRLRTNRDAPPNVRRPAPQKRSRSRDSSVDHRSQQQISNNTESSNRKRRSRSRSAPRNARSERDSERDRPKAKSRYDERESGKGSSSSSRREANYKDQAPSNRSNSISKDNRSSHKTLDSGKNKDASVKETSHSKNAEEKGSHSEKHKEKKHKRSKSSHHESEGQPSSKKSKSGKKSSSEVDTEADNASVSAKGGGGKKKKQKNKEIEQQNKYRVEKDDVENAASIGDKIENVEKTDGPTRTDEDLATAEHEVGVTFKDYSNIWPEENESHLLMKKSPSSGLSVNDEAPQADHLQIYADGSDDTGRLDSTAETESAVNDYGENKIEGDIDEAVQFESTEASEVEMEEEEEEEEEEENLNEEERECEEDADDNVEGENDGDEVDDQKSNPDADADSILTAQVPELSKWERDDIDVNKQDDASVTYSQQRGKPKIDVVKPTLPADIVQRAEKAILEKAPKAIITGASGDARKIDSVKSTEVGGAKDKEAISKNVADVGKPISSNNSRSLEKSEMDKKESDPLGRSAERAKGRETVRPGSSNSNRRRSVSIERKRDKSRAGDSVRRDSSQSRSLERDRGRRRSPDRARSRERDRSKTSNRRSRSPRRNVRRSRSSEGRRNVRRKEDSRSRSKSRSRDDKRMNKNDSNSKVSSLKIENDRSEDHFAKGIEKDVFKGDRRDIKKDVEEKSQRRSRSPVPSKARSTSDVKKRSRSKEKENVSNVREKVERKPSTAASTIDESKFEPDYDTPSDEEASGNNKNQVSGKIEDDKAPQQRRSSSSSSSSGSGSSAESNDSSPAKKKRRKLSTDAQSSSAAEKKHKNKKHKKHKKHKHKHKKNKKSHKHKDDSGNKDSSKSKGKSKH